MQSSALFLTVVFSAVSGGSSHVMVKTEEAVESHCQKDVTLLCNISTTHAHLDIVRMFWMGPSLDKLCSALNPETDGRFRCHYTSQTQLALTVVKPEKGDEGEYVCKLFTNHGHARANTTLIVQELCSRTNPDVEVSADYSRNGNQASALQSKWTSLVLLLAALLLALK